jgi:hypothetical protein
MKRWAASFNDTDNRRIGEDHIGNQVVSTVWLGLNHNFGDGTPLIFETMVFGGPHDQFQDRYHTEQEALEGHQRVVTALKEGKSLS